MQSTNKCAKATRVIINHTMKAIYFIGSKIPRNGVRTPFFAYITFLPMLSIELKQ